MTGHQRRNDILRQGANVLGALAQFGVGWGGAVLGLDIATVSATDDTLVVPAEWAFLIWAPIFLTGLVYAVHQALPRNRTDPTSRRVGWWTAAAFALNTAWEVVFPLRQFVPAQLVLIALLAVLVRAFVRLDRTGAAAPAQRWLVALPVGLFTGWIAAATFVGVGETLAGLGIVQRGPGAGAVGAVTLLLGGAVAVAILWAARRAPVQATGAFVAAVVWGFGGVVAKQMAASPATTAAALVGALVVAAAAAVVFARRRSGKPFPPVAQRG